MPRGYRRSPSPFRERYRRRREEYSPRHRDSPFERRPYSRDSRERYDRRRSRSRSRSRGRSRSRSRSLPYRRDERSRSKSTPPRVTSRMREEDKPGYSEAFRKAMSAARKAEMALSSQFESLPKHKGSIVIEDLLKKNLFQPSSSDPSFPVEVFTPPDTISMGFAEGPSSTTSLGAAMKEPSLREVSDIAPFHFKEGTDVLLTSRFERLEYLAGNPVELQKRLNSSEVSLEDISVVIERNLPMSSGNPAIRMSFISEVDVFVLPRGLKEGERCIFDRPEIKAFNHDRNIDDEEYVETRKVVVRQDLKSSNWPQDSRRSPPRPPRGSSDSRDTKRPPLPRFEVERGRGRGRGRRRIARQRGGSASRGARARSPEARSQRKYEAEGMDEAELPDFSLRPNKGYVQPNMRSPTDIPKHGSYFLHDDREDFEIDRGRGRGYRGSRPSRRRGGNFSRFSIDRRMPYSLINSRCPWRNHRGKHDGSKKKTKKRSPEGIHLDKWKHDKFEEVQEEEETIRIENSKKEAS